jgi:cyclase
MFKTIRNLASFLFKFIIAFALLSAPGYTADETISPVAVTDQIYVLAGKGGNIGLFPGEDGAFLIDDQFAPSTEKIVKAIQSVGAEHPRFLINTHYHGDHTGGNDKLG